MLPLQGMFLSNQGPSLLTSAYHQERDIGEGAGAGMVQGRGIGMVERGACQKGRVRRWRDGCQSVAGDAWDEGCGVVGREYKVFLEEERGKRRSLEGL